jgi:ubiquitin carboxyl-terminal hydrolase 4/11/15
LIEFRFFPSWTFKLEKIAQPSKSSVAKTCNFCKKSRSDLLKCICSQVIILKARIPINFKKVYYCDRICQKEDWKSHADGCRKARIEKEKSPKQQQPTITDPQQLFTRSSKRGLAGLQNIGNTCFMNSGLQCLSNVYILTKYFLSRAYLPEINENNLLGTGGKLARSYANLLEEVWVDDKPHASTWEIKKIIAKLAPQVNSLKICFL